MCLLFGQKKIGSEPMSRETHANQMNNTKLESFVSNILFKIRKSRWQDRSDGMLVLPDPV